MINCTQKKNEANTNIIFTKYNFLSSFRIVLICMFFYTVMFNVMFMLKNQRRHVSRKI